MSKRKIENIDISAAKNIGLPPEKELKAIGRVAQNGSTITTYDENGNRIQSMSSSGGELKGFGTDFFVVKKGANLAVTYDADCKQIKAINTAFKKNDIVMLQDLLEYELIDNLTQWKIQALPKIKKLNSL